MPPFDNRPSFFRIGTLPFAITEIIILLQVIGMLLVVISPGTLIQNTQFSSPHILSGELWRLITYQLFDPPSLPWALGLFLFYSFGKQVESALGQKAYIRLISGSLLLPALIGLIVAQLPFIGPTSGFLGNQILSLSVFCAAVSMQPNHTIPFLAIRLKWLASVIVNITLLQFIMISFWLGACMLSTGVYFSISYMLKTGLGTRLFNPLSHRGTKPRRKKTKPSEPKIKPRSRFTSQPNSEVDSILEKISAHGFQSLSPSEKETLNQASQNNK